MCYLLFLNVCYAWCALVILGVFGICKVCLELFVIYHNLSKVIGAYHNLSIVIGSFHWLSEFITTFH